MPTIIGAIVLSVLFDFIRDYWPQIVAVMVALFGIWGFVQCMLFVFY